jgi:Na+/proline symporter
MFAIFSITKQFHTSIIENNKESHIRTAIWLFPLYLLLFNILFSQSRGEETSYLKERFKLRHLFLIDSAVFNNFQRFSVSRGFSAAISMIIVSSIALATMLSNNLLIPYGFIGFFNILHRKNSNRS